MSFAGELRRGSYAVAADCEIGARSHRRQAKYSSSRASSTIDAKPTSAASRGCWTVASSTPEQIAAAKNLVADFEKRMNQRNDRRRRGSRIVPG